VTEVVGMRDRPHKESASEQYRQLAKECLEMVPTIPEERAESSWWRWRVSGFAWPKASKTTI